MGPVGVPLADEFTVAPSQAPCRSPLADEFTVAPSQAPWRSPLADEFTVAPSQAPCRSPLADEPSRAHRNVHTQMRPYGQTAELRSVPTALPL